uniref:Uncharacterized protein n=1 Tax=Ixodes ricinus TaxID=34613 RepID=A0A147BM82_IXORI
MPMRYCTGLSVLLAVSRRNHTFLVWLVRACVLLGEEPLLGCTKVLLILRYCRPSTPTAGCFYFKSKHITTSAF